VAVLLASPTSLWTVAMMSAKVLAMVEP